MPIPLEFCEVWFKFDVTGDNESMYSHLAYGVAATITQAAVDAGFTSFATNFKPRLPASVTINPGHVLEQTTAGIRRWDAASTGQIGNNAGAGLPNNCSVLVRKSTALGGRRNRGRMYIPCPIETTIDAAGVFTVGEVNSWNTVLGLLMPGGTVHTAFGFLGDPVVLHETGSQTPAVVTGLTCQNKIGTQRRRMRR